jgi:hypothetical protein
MLAHVRAGRKNRSQRGARGRFQHSELSNEGSGGLRGLIERGCTQRRDRGAFLDEEIRNDASRSIRS